MYNAFSTSTPAQFSHELVKIKCFSKITPWHEDINIHINTSAKIPPVTVITLDYDEGKPSAWTAKLGSVVKVV